MPKPDDSRLDAVRSELTDVLVQVVGCAPEDVVDNATLRKLGVDSLAMVEMADELGPRFDVFIPDDTVNGLRTVADTVAAVAHLEDDAAHSSKDHQEAAPSPVAEPEAATEPTVPLDADGRMSAMKRLALWFAAVGAVVGILFGFGGSYLVSATGLRPSTLPPLTLPTTPAPTTATPTPTPTPEPSEEETPDPDPTLTIANTQVSPGERFTLEGRFPGMQGETLQVEVKAPGEKWDAFPVTARARGNGVYRTQIYTTRTGEREFRMAHLGSNKTTPAVSVRIG
ncbi:acyl carrier protein [Aeromicrobium sp.]|uniref:acyl carrier protein n=1 Tax=Aeromicrobium sp. TaxID=1871063 RepID=UPI003D6A5963